MLIRLIITFVFPLFTMEYESFKATENCRTNVTVSLDYGKFIGARCNGRYERFTGIPFAEPPVGSLRLQNPIPPRKRYPNFDATRPAPACTQQAPSAGSGFWQTLFTPAMKRVSPMFAPMVEGQEDCLTIDIIRPVLNRRTAKDGGAFVFGSTKTYPGQSLVMKSMRLNQPIIYVAANYRLGAFGFLGGKEVGKAKVGNLGLKDQRLALKWVKKYISRFGGDPKKVMLFGQSAGAMSVAYHLMAYNGKLNGLFRAAICESGSALTASALSDGGGQKTYDILIQQVGCSNSTDTLECLRKVEFQTLADAQNEISGILSIDFYPPQFSVHVDGEFLTDAPRSLINRGKIAKIPLISGNQDDEGTALGFGQVALISHSRFQKFIKKLFNNATESQLKTLLSLYPEDITQGSPFNTGHLNAITPVYKRYSALLGDFVFQSLRRKFMRVIQSKMPTWGYLDCGLKTTPILGSFHTSELLAVFDQVPGIEHLYRANDFQSRWINFAHKLNPNPRGFSKWEKYGIEGKIMKFGPQGSLNMIKDDFRNDSIEFLIENDGILVF